jgi:predicted RNA-binding protein
MCLAKAYLGKSTGEPVLENVAHMRLRDDHVELETLLGEHAVIPGRAVEIDFSTSTILLDKRGRADKA